MTYKNNKSRFSSSLLGALMLSTSALISTQAFAQSFDEGDLLVSEEDTGSNLNLTDYIVGEFGLVRANNGAVSRATTIYNVGVDVPWDWGRFYATYGGAEFQLDVTQKLRQPEYNPDNLPAKRTVTTKTDDTDLREAFVQANLGSYVTVSAGRQRNAWGQFELLSPATIMLPLNANFTSLVPNKLDLLQAQDQVKISIFPTSKIEISLYAMSNLRTDNSVDESAKTWLTPFNEINSDGRLAPIERDDQNEIDLQYEDTSDIEQTAVRVLFYPNWGTIGFTHHDGINAFIPLLHANVSSGDTTLFNNGREETTYFTSVGSGYEKDETYLYYPEGTLTAFEAAIPVGAWTWKVEFAQIEAYTGLDSVGGGSIHLSNESGFDRTNVANFVNAIYANTRDEKVRGNAVYKGTRTTSGIGFQYQGPTWNINVTALSLGEFEPVTEADKKIVEAYETLEAETDTPNDGSDFGTIPLINAFRTRGDEDQHRYGFSLGAVGIGFGIGGLYSYNFTETLSLGMGLGFVQLDTNQGSSDDYKTETEGFTTQTSLAWRF